MTDERLCLLALTMMPRVGPVVARQLLAGCGSAQAVLNEKKSHLVKIPGIGPAVASEIKAEQYLAAAEKEVRWMERKSVQMITWTDSVYPVRLSHIESSPLVLFLKGNVDLNARRTVAIVGTRSPSDYAKSVCSRLVQELQDMQPLIVSGLAYGIDIIAHKTSLEAQLPTVAVLGHGLDRLYPAVHSKIAEAMMEQGGVLTEFMSGTMPDKENFPMRNRIIAGLSDAVVVVESGRKGGSIITAEFANDFHKDVFAVPGQVDNPHSAGCNFLIKTHKAHLMESAADLSELMRWDVKSPGRVIQTQLMLDLSPEEQSTVSLLQGSKDMHIDALIYHSALNPGQLAGVLLNLECKGLVKSMPGRKFALA